MNEINPTRFTLWILPWICPEHLLEEIEGNLLQKLEHDVKTFGEGQAATTVECGLLFSARDHFEEIRFHWNLTK